MTSCSRCSRMLCPEIFACSLPYGLFTSALDSVSDTSLMVFRKWSFYPGSLSFIGQTLCHSLAPILCLGAQPEPAPRAANLAETYLNLWAGNTKRALGCAPPEFECPRSSVPMGLPSEKLHEVWRIFLSLFITAYGLEHL